jgi:AcrR family transcriptional regulator
MSTLALRGPDSPASESRQAHDRILDAALRCVARWGLAKTTVDDVAREAGVGRATLYRLFPGGRDALLDAVVASETAAFLTRLDARLRTAASLEEVLVACIVEAGDTVTGHGALQFLLAFEPEAILPHLAFQRLDALLRWAAEVGGPLLEPWLPDGSPGDGGCSLANDGAPADGAPAADDASPAERAARAAEWVARIVVSYVVAPSPGVNVRDPESVRRFVRTFVLPGLAPAVPRRTTS